MLMRKMAEDFQISSTHKKKSKEAWKPSLLERASSAVPHSSADSVLPFGKHEEAAGATAPKLIIQRSDLVQTMLNLMVTTQLR